MRAEGETGFAVWVAGEDQAGAVVSLLDGNRVAGLLLAGLLELDLLELLEFLWVALSGHGLLGYRGRVEGGWGRFCV